MFNGRTRKKKWLNGWLHCVAIFVSYFPFYDGDISLNYGPCFFLSGQAVKVESYCCLYSRKKFLKCERSFLRELYRRPKIICWTHLGFNSCLYNVESLIFFVLFRYSKILYSGTCGSSNLNRGRKIFWHTCNHLFLFFQCMMQSRLTWYTLGK